MEGMMSRLIIFSADAMVGEDMEKLQRMPNFCRYLSGGSRVGAVRSVYPTITYPAHATIVTGVYPDKHGIPGNLDPRYMVDSQAPIPWLWEYGAMKAEDLFTAAKNAGKTTAAVFWPVTGNHPDIDWLIDEYWTQGEEDSIPAAFARMGSSPEVLEIVKKNQALLEGVERQHPACDEFVVTCAADILKSFKPDLLMLHPANIDGARHQKGLFHSDVDQAIADTDRWIGQLASAAIEAGVWEDTNFFLISDHGQLEIHRAVNLNVFLAEAGLLRIEGGRVTDWDAWCLSGGMSAMVFVKNPGVSEQVYSLFCRLRDEGVWGIGEVFTAGEAAKHRYAGDFSFVLETDGYTSFGDGWKRPIVKPLDSRDYRLGFGTHGYLPEKGPQPILAANGPDIARGGWLAEASLIDEAPTFAYLLGTNLPSAEGRVLQELLKKPGEPQPRIKLRPVIRENVNDALRLRVAPAQQRFVVPNAVSLAQAYAFSEYTPWLAYDGDTPVGFCMEAFDKDEKTPSIRRLMVGQEYQGKGYGREMLSLLLQLIAVEYPGQKVLISFTPENAVARALCESMGFTSEDRYRKNEIVYSIIL